MKAEDVVAIMVVVGVGGGGEDKAWWKNRERKNMQSKIALCFKSEISKLPIVSVLCSKFCVQLSLRLKKKKSFIGCETDIHNL